MKNHRTLPSIAAWTPVWTSGIGDYYDEFIKWLGLTTSCFAGAILLSATAAHAKQTTAYAYDALGRLVSTGTSANSSSLYKYDLANNRAAKACCLAIGGEIENDGFDPYFYALAYSDIRIAGVIPYEHWLLNGFSEIRNPNRFFDTAYYRTTYGVSTNVNALTDYHSTGWRLGRNPSPEFSTSRYLAAYPDIAAANIDPLWHYLRYGYAEGRSRFPVL